MLQRKSLPTHWLVIHWVIIVNFLFEIAYAGYMVFFIVRPKGVTGPLADAAVKLIEQQPNLMMARRAYATEAWIAIGGLAIYLAITEIAPRMWQLAPSPSQEGS